MPFGQQEPVITRIPRGGTRRPPVLTKRCAATSENSLKEAARCSKLVSDQFLILFGNANRPDKVGITLNHKRTSFPRNRWQERRVQLTASLPSLIHCSTVPLLL